MAVPSSILTNTVYWDNSNTAMASDTVYPGKLIQTQLNIANNEYEFCFGNISFTETELKLLKELLKERNPEIYL